MSRKVPETITEEEAVRLCLSTADPKKKLMIGLGFWQGMRVSEIAGIRPEDIDIKNKMLFIRHARTANGLPKKDVTRQIPIHPVMDKPLEKYKNKYLPFTESIRTLQTWFEEMSLYILGRKLHIHNLRHSCGSHMIQEMGIPAIQVMDFLGHANMGTIHVYNRTNPQTMKSYVRGAYV
jgi:integrase